MMIFLVTFYPLLNTFNNWGVYLFSTEVFTHSSLCCAK